VKNYLWIFAVGMVTTFLITPLVEMLANSVGAVDRPTERKVHTKSIPRLGGVAIYLGFLLASVLFLSVDRELMGILLGATFILALGVIDDMKDLSPKVKFLGQLGAAVILILSGVQIEFVGNPFGKGLLYLGGWGVFLTLFWVVGLTNTVNFIDGLDGLAAGVSVIALTTLCYVAHQTGQLGTAMISIALAGSALGFLKHNFHPAKVFMGDSGSMFLGFMLGAITVQGVMKSVAAIALLVPIVIMGVPIFDTISAIFRRFRNKRPVTQADRNHIHHRLLYRGFSHQQTVLIIYFWSVLLSMAALILNFATFMEKITVFVVLAILSFFFDKFVGLFEDFRRR